MRHFFVSLFLALTLVLTFMQGAKCSVFTLYDPPEIEQNGNISYPKITKLESIILNKTYENEDIDARLQRLEQKTCNRIFSGSDLSWRVENIMQKIDKSELYNIPSKELASIEKKILGKSYKKDDLENRLSRLEYQMLGATQSGKPDERYQTILSASTHYLDLGNPFSQPIHSITNPPIYPTGSGIKNTFKNIFHTISNGGSITGFTPQISPYGYSAPYGFDPRYGTYGPRHQISGFGQSLYNPNLGCHHPRCNHMHQLPHPTNRYFNFNRNVSSGMGVRILD